jgi:hypothetical protein
LEMYRYGNVYMMNDNIINILKNGGIW